MKNFKSIISKVNLKLLSSLSAMALLTSCIGAGTASSWTFHQPTLPKEFRNR